ncbi:MAG: hypothetical protein M9894_14035 [Planctomycetes bacterium]|nr:hypothetical protein [Planctomycetota bacterium]
MAIKVDRPAGGAGDDVVVFVARRLEEARAARDALTAAGVAIELPDAALEALFEGGAASVPVRVRSRDVVRALEVVDAAFPRAEEPEDDDEPPPPPPLAEEEQAPAEPDDAALDAAARRRQDGRIERTAFKVLVIACGSALLPPAGLPFALVAVIGGAWLLLRPDAPRGRAAAGLAIGAASLGWNAFVAASLLAR